MKVALFFECTEVGIQLPCRGYVGQASITPPVPPCNPINLWFQVEDMFQSIGTPQVIEEVIVKLIVTLTKVYVIGAKGGHFKDAHNFLAFFDPLPHPPAFK